MSGGHLDDVVLHAYAEDRLADVDAWSVEAHLDRCLGCRRRLPLDESTAQLVAEVGAALRDRLHRGEDAVHEATTPGRARQLLPGRVRQLLPGWARWLVPGWARSLVPGRVRSLVPGRVRSLVPGRVRSLVPGRVRPGSRWRRNTVLLGAGPAARAGWLGAVAVTLALVAAVEFGGLPIRPWVLLLIAPVLPVLGVAASYGRHTDPLHDLVASTPYAGLRIVLWRTLSVLAVAVPVSLAAGTVSGIGVPGLWLLPCLTLTVLTLGIGAVVEPYRAATAVALGWVALVLGPVGGARLVAPAAVPGWLAGAAVAVGLMVAGTRLAHVRGNRMSGEVTG